MIGALQEAPPLDARVQRRHSDVLWRRERDQGDLRRKTSCFFKSFLPQTPQYQSSSLSRSSAHPSISVWAVQGVIVVLWRPLCRDFSPTIFHLLTWQSSPTLDKRLLTYRCFFLQGDSGGPLLITGQAYYDQRTVIGVTSHGPECGRRAQAGVYTRVAPYVGWIDSIIWKTRLRTKRPILMGQNIDAPSFDEINNKNLWTWKTRKSCLFSNLNNYLINLMFFVTLE